VTVFGLVLLLAGLIWLLQLRVPRPTPQPFKGAGR
jgi:hypothetical protein